MARKKAREVQKVLDKWQAAWNASNLEKVMSVFDKDIILSQQGLKDLPFAGIKRGYARDFKTNPPGAAWNGVLKETFFAGKLAVAVSQWEFRARKKGSKAVSQRLRCVDVLRPTAKGWKFIRTFNYPEPK
jgi:uncharacterized protein (TIGR02246 family)